MEVCIFLFGLIFIIYNERDNPFMKFNLRKLGDALFGFNNVEQRKTNIGNFQPLYFGGSSSFNSDKSMNLSAVYRCVNVIAESIAQLPIEIYKVDSKGYKIRNPKHVVYSVLNQKPNVRMTRYTLISLIIQSMLLKGNAYVYILRDKNQNVSQLIYIPSEYVTIIPPKYIYEPVKYQIVGIDKTVEENEILHFLNYTNDGVLGISTIQFALNTLGLSWDAEKHAQNFFSGGCAVGGVIESEKVLNDIQKRELAESWNNAHGQGQQNKVAILENGLKYSPIAINPVDAQLLQTREFNVIDICRFFGVSPIKVFDLAKSSYSTIEASNLSFLTDTISPLLQKLELEFERKLFKENENIDVKFDISYLIRTDKASQASYYQSMFNIGAISVNEIRKDIDLPPVENGDNNFVQVNLQTLNKSVSDDPKDAQDIKEALND